MDYSTSLNNLQAKQLIDVTQTWQAWRAAVRQFQGAYKGGMGWKQIGGKEEWRLHKKCSYKSIGYKPLLTWKSWTYSVPTTVIPACRWREPSLFISRSATIICRALHENLALDCYRERAGMAGRRSASNGQYAQ